MYNLTNLTKNLYRIAKKPRIDKIILGKTSHKYGKLHYLISDLQCSNKGSVIVECTETL